MLSDGFLAISFDNLGAGATFSSLYCRGLPPDASAEEIIAKDISQRVLATPERAAPRTHRRALSRGPRLG